MSEVDKFIGRKIRARRTELGKSQGELADSIGVAFQQVQKYETGINRVSASRLWAIADELKAPIEYFFEGVGSATQANKTDATGANDTRSAHDVRSLHLVRAFQALPEPKKRAVLAIVKSMTQDGHEASHNVQSEQA